MSISGVAAHHLLLGFPPFDPKADPIEGAWSSARNSSAVARWCQRTSGAALESTLSASRERILRVCAEDGGTDGAGAFDVIRMLLNPDPCSRLGAQQGIQEFKALAWFEGFDWDSLAAGSLLPPALEFNFATEAVPSPGSGEVFDGF